ncbi:MAG: polysaccharide deacetylase family protein [Flammeovirgaceae bacterium]
MKSNLYVFLSFLLVLACGQAQEKQAIQQNMTTRELCVTIDDLPVVGYSKTDIQHLSMITDSLISTCLTYDIPAIGYVNENKLYQGDQFDSTRLELLERWLKHGLELGNHTFSHKNYHQVPFEEYTQDILAGEKATRKLVEQYESKLRYFRHPYLRIGKTKTHHDSLVQFLTKHHYIESPVTIDNADYLFALAYHKAYIKNHQADMDKIGKDYVAYMEQKLLFYESMSQKLFNRNMKHTLLIHANLLNAKYLDNLAEMYQQHGYTFVSQTAVLTDAAYQSEISNYGNWGISWLDRWALSKGKKGDFFKGDPVTPDYIQNYN